MENSTNQQSEAGKIAEIEEALRLQEIDSVERENEVEALKAEVRSLQKAKLEVEAKLPVNLEEATFIVDNQDYQFVYPALKVDGEKLTANQMIDRPEILRMLVRNGSAAIKLINNQ